MNNKSMIINFIDSKHPVPLKARRPEHVAHGRRDAQAEGAARGEQLFKLRADTLLSRLPSP